MPENQNLEHYFNRGNDFKSRYSGECICPNCGFKIPHEIEIPCHNKVCQKCGIIMTDLKSTDNSDKFSS